MGLFGKKNNDTNDRIKATTSGYGINGTITRAENAADLTKGIGSKIYCASCGSEYFEIEDADKLDELSMEYVPETVYKCTECGRIYCQRCVHDMNKCVCGSKPFYVKPVEVLVKSRFFR